MACGPLVNNYLNILTTINTLPSFYGSTSIHFGYSKSGGRNSFHTSSRPIVQFCQQSLIKTHFFLFRLG